MTRTLASRALSAALLVLAGCHGSDPALDRIAPVTAAYPRGAGYREVQYVTLAGPEASTIHYSLDGIDPEPGASNTVSGADPIYWIRIGPGETTLKFFAEDRWGNRERTRTERYLVDPTPRPQVEKGTLAFAEVCPGAGGAGEVLMSGAYGETVSGLALPFGFALFGRYATELWVSSSGLAGFAPTAMGYTENWGLQYAPDGAVAPYWDTLSATTVCAALGPSSASIEWRGKAFRSYDSGSGTSVYDDVEVELVLHDTGLADFVYGPMHTADGSLATILVKGLDGTPVILVSDNSPNPDAAAGHSYTIDVR